MSTYEDDIAAALIGEMDPDTAGNRSSLRYAVQTQMFDRQTGALLDIRSSVLVTVTTSAGRRVMEVFDAPRWDATAEQFTAACAQHDITLELLDGRVLFADEPGPTPTAANTDATPEPPR